MTTQELNNTLTQYAQEDINYSKENGSHMIAQTNEGTVTISNIGEVFQAHNGLGKQLTKAISENEMIQFMISAYDVSEVVIED